MTYKVRPLGEMMGQAMFMSDVLKLFKDAKEPFAPGLRFPDNNVMHNVFLPTLPGVAVSRLFVGVNFSQCQSSLDTKGTHGIPMKVRSPLRSQQCSH
jgi:hypothetical protein